MEWPSLVPVSVAILQLAVVLAAVDLALSLLRTAREPERSTDE
jgi:hypothetical protein